MASVIKCSSRAMKTLTSRLFSALCLVPVIAFGLAQPLSSISEWKHLVEDSRVMLGENSSWLVQEPRLVSPGYVESMAFVPYRNEAVFITRETLTLSSQDLLSDSGPIATNSRRLHVVDLATGRSRQVFTLSTEMPLDFLSGMGRTGVVVAQSYRDSRQKFYVHLESGKGIKVEVAEDDWIDDIDCDMPGIIAFGVLGISEGETKTTKIRVIDFNSGWPREIFVDLPKQAQQPYKITEDYVLMSFNGEGGFEYNLASKSGKEVSEEIWKRRIAEWQVDDSAAPESTFDLDHQSAKGAGIWLKIGDDELQRMMLSKDADRAILSEDNTKILARVEGAAFLYQLSRISQPAATKYLAKNAKNNAMKLAKEAGIAVAMYSSDHDDRFPPSASNAVDLLNPYTKNKKALENIVWTNLIGQSIIEIETPSQTMMGYVRGPGGRAVVYCDTSVRWLPDQ